MEAQRYCNSEGYVPKWERVSTYGTPPDINKRCGNPICANVKCERLIKPSFAPLDEIKVFFNPHSLESILCCAKHSFDSQTVTGYLRSDINITPQDVDVLCHSWHKLHSHIIKELKNAYNTRSRWYATAQNS